jgi:hypothetical protein
MNLLVYEMNCKDESSWSELDTVLIETEQKNDLLFILRVKR